MALLKYRDGKGLDSGGAGARYLKALIEGANEYRRIEVLRKVLDFFGKLHLGNQYKTGDEVERIESKEYFEDYEEYLKHA